MPEALERRATTPLTDNRSEKVTAWVSIVPWMLVAAGGAIMNEYW